jgi:hypothetical protein
MGWNMDYWIEHVESTLQVGYADLVYILISVFSGIVQEATKKNFLRVFIALNLTNGFVAGNPSGLTEEVVQVGRVIGLR